MLFIQKIFYKKVNVILNKYDFLFLITFASQDGCLDVIKYLHSIKAPVDGNAIAFASDGGHLEVVKYLHFIEAPIIEEAIAFASSAGYLDIVKFLHSVNAPINESAMICASYNGHLNVVKYLHSINAPIIGNAIASENEDPRIVGYNRSIINKNAIEWAFENKQFAVVDFLKEHYPQLCY
jgi:ankyrin repeat protein